jgi:hypothetical protein
MSAAPRSFIAQGYTGTAVDNAALLQLGGSQLKNLVVAYGGAQKKGKLGRRRFIAKTNTIVQRGRTDVVRKEARSDMKTRAALLEAVYKILTAADFSSAEMAIGFTQLTDGEADHADTVDVIFELCASRLRPDRLREQHAHYWVEKTIVFTNALLAKKRRWAKGVLSTRIASEQCVVWNQITEMVDGNTTDGVTKEQFGAWLRREKDLAARVAVTYAGAPAALLRPASTRVLFDARSAEIAAAAAQVRRPLAESAASTSDADPPGRLPSKPPPSDSPAVLRSPSSPMDSPPAPAHRSNAERRAASANARRSVRKASRALPPPSPPMDSPTPSPPMDSPNAKRRAASAKARRAVRKASKALPPPGTPTGTAMSVVGAAPMRSPGAPSGLSPSLAPAAVRLPPPPMSVGDAVPMPSAGALSGTPPPLAIEMGTAADSKRALREAMERHEQRRTQRKAAGHAEPLALHQTVQPEIGLPLHQALPVRSSPPGRFLSPSAGPHEPRTLRMTSEELAAMGKRRDARGKQRRAAHRAAARERARLEEDRARAVQAARECELLEEERARAMQAARERERLKEEQCARTEQATDRAAQERKRVAEESLASVLAARKQMAALLAQGQFARAAQGVDSSMSPHDVFGHLVNGVASAGSVAVRPAADARALERRALERRAARVRVMQLPQPATSQPVYGGVVHPGQSFDDFMKSMK